jgi:hypothetical protein
VVVLERDPEATAAILTRWLQQVEAIAAERAALPAVPPRRSGRGSGR